MLQNLYSLAMDNWFITIMVVGGLGTGLVKFGRAVSAIIHHAIDAKNGTDYSGKYYRKDEDDD